MAGKVGGSGSPVSFDDETVVHQNLSNKSDQSVASNLSDIKPEPAKSGFARLSSKVGQFIRSIPQKIKTSLTNIGQSKKTPQPTPDLNKFSTLRSSETNKSNQTNTNPQTGADFHLEPTAQAIREYALSDHRAGTESPQYGTTRTADPSTTQFHERQQHFNKGYSQFSALYHQLDAKLNHLSDPTTPAPESNTIVDLYANVAHLRNDAFALRQDLSSIAELNPGGVDKSILRYLDNFPEIALELGERIDKISPSSTEQAGLRPFVQLGDDLYDSDLTQNDLNQINEELGVLDSLTRQANDQFQELSSLEHPDSDDVEAYRSQLESLTEQFITLRETSSEFREFNSSFPGVTEANRALDYYSGFLTGLSNAVEKRFPSGTDSTQSEFDLISEPQTQSSIDSFNEKYLSFENEAQQAIYEFDDLIDFSNEALAQYNDKLSALNERADGLKQSLSELQENNPKVNVDKTDARLNEVIDLLDYRQKALENIKTSPDAASVTSLSADDDTPGLSSKALELEGKLNRLDERVQLANSTNRSVDSYSREDINKFNQHVIELVIEANELRSELEAHIPKGVTNSNGMDFYKHIDFIADDLSSLSGSRPD